MRDISRKGLLEELSSLRPDLERQGITHIALFGSRARQDNRSDSDIDLVVEIDEQRKFSLLDLIGVQHTIEDSLGIAAHLTTRRSLQSPLREEVQNDEIPVF